MGPDQPSYEGCVKDFAEPCGLPLANIHRVPQSGSPEQVAKQYASEVHASVCGFEYASQCARSYGCLTCIVELR